MNVPVKYNLLGTGTQILPSPLEKINDMKAEWSCLIYISTALIINEK
jgi:hypothetical protein